MPRCLTRRVLGYANLGRPSLNKRKQRYGRDKYRCCHAFGLLASSVCSTGENKSAQNGQRLKAMEESYGIPSRQWAFRLLPSDMHVQS
ncbi:hypothetical protein IG631_09750 [Alternaria alternata]|nr:hypothetical protein IG631_09750 [Alternaria alternata]